MHYFHGMNAVQRNTDHREYSNYILFWQELMWILVNYFLQALVTSLQDDTWVVVLSFDQVNNFAYEGMANLFKAIDLFFSFSLFVSVIE